MNVQGPSWPEQIRVLIALDEVGRGSIAGPLCVGGSLWIKTPSPILPLSHFKDSKSLTPLKRDHYVSSLSQTILQETPPDCLPVITDEWKRPHHLIPPNFDQVSYWRLQGLALGWVDSASIDQWGLARALGLAAYQCITALTSEECLILVDGAHPFLMIEPFRSWPHSTCIKGDAKIPMIALSSIIAKVMRDRWMIGQHQQFPTFQFDQNKGYGTAFHRRQIEKYGVCPLHRLSFIYPGGRPAKDMI